MVQTAAWKVSRFNAIALGFSIPISAAADNALLAIVILTWLAAGSYASRWASVRSNPVMKPLLAFLAVALTGLTWASAPVAELRKAAIDIIVLASLPAFITLFDAQRIRQLAIDAFLLASAIIVVLSLVIATGVFDSIPGTKGVPGYPIVFKAHLTQNFLMTIAVLLALLRATQTQGARRWLYLLGASAATFDVIFLVPGRTGQAAFVAGALYVAFSRFRWRGLMIAAAAIAGLGAVSWLMPASVIRDGTELAWQEASQWRSDKPQTTSVGLRFEYYRNAVEIITQHPVLGVGTGGFPAAYRELIAGTGMSSVGHPHNAFLLVAAELGAVGLGLFLWLLLALWRSAARMPKPAYPIAMRALLVIFVAAGMVSAPFTDHAEGLFFVWAVAIFLATISDVAPPIA